MSSQNDVQNAQELTEFVKGLLNQMNERFKTMTDSIVGRYIIFLYNIWFLRIDEMSERIDDLESTVTKLVEESNQNQIGNNMEGNNQEMNYNK